MDGWIEIHVDRQVDVPAKSVGNGLFFAHAVCQYLTCPFSHTGPSHLNPPQIPTGQTDT